MTNVPPPTLSTLYNQSVLEDEDFVANFVARHETLKTLCRRLDRIGPEDDGQHQILIGVRGMGKTSLLRRLSIKINCNKTLSERFVPLLFREEQYNVLSLRDFWRNCCESLAEWAENPKRAENCDLVDLVARLDEKVLLKARADVKNSAEIFETALQSLGKRAVLFIDNLDLILDSLKESDLWSLRSSLQARGGPILIGAATQPIREAADRDAAFYEFFEPCYLEPLSLPETETCMRSLATNRRQAGQPVIDVLQTDPARLRVLHRLTGGNPRVLAFTYRLLESEDSRSAMADLERLLDEVTPHYKALVEEYTGQSRAIIDAIALHWDPVTTRELSRITGLPTTTLSPQVTRLRKDGLIERNEASGSYSAHQIVERFLNIWYLMRHGTRRTKHRMRWLVAFLSNFYTKKQLIQIGHDARESGRIKDWTKDYALAFEQTLQVAPFERRHSVFCDAVGNAGGIKAELSSTSDATEVHAMVNKGVVLSQGGDTAAALEAYDAVIVRFGDSDDAELQVRTAMAMIYKGITLGRGGDTAAALEAYDAVIVRFGDSDDAELQVQTVRAMVNKGITLGRGGDTAAELEAYDAVIAHFGDSDDAELQVQTAIAMVNKGITLGRGEDTAAEIKAYDAVIARFGYSDDAELQVQTARAMIYKGITLGRGEDTAAEIKAYDAVIARFGYSDDAELQVRTAMAMIYKGATLGQGGDTAAALEAYDAVIVRFGDSDDAELQVRTAMAMIYKGITLGRGGDTAAALEAYDAVIVRFGDSDDAELQVQTAMAMVNKGITLGRGGDTAAEIKAYDAVIARFGDSDDAQLQEATARAMVNKGITLGRGGDTAVALEAYDAVIARFGDSDDAELQVQTARAMVNKGITLGRGGDTAVALEAYDAVIARFGDSDDAELQVQTAMAMVNKGITLGRGEDTAAAHEAYDEVIARFGDSDDAQLQEATAMAMVNKGITLGQGGDTAAAAHEAYDAVIARFGDSDDAQLQVQTARAMVNKGITLGRGEDTAAAFEAYDAVITRFGDSDDAELQVQTAMAMINKGATLGQGGDTAAALEAYDAVIVRFGDSDDAELQVQTAMAMVNKGITLGQGGDTAAALEAYDAVIARFGDSDDAQLQKYKDSAYTNLFWFYLSENRQSDAEETMKQVGGISSQVRAIMNAGLALQSENYGEATKSLKTVLVPDSLTAGVELIEPLERLIRLVIANGCGKWLIEWFERPTTTNFRDRYTPIYAALKAAVRGKEQLLDVNPEMREAAEIIMNRISGSGGGWLSEK